MGGVVLLELQLTNRIAAAAQHRQQLMAAVAQGLQPLGLGGANEQSAAPQFQRTAVGSELGSGQFRPGLPERGQASLLLPLALEVAEAAA